MNIVCIGSGYVGSVTAAAFACLGHSVTVVDVDPQKVAVITSGRSPIYEPGLEAIIRHTAGSSLFATTEYTAVSQADIVFICVGTPSRPDSTANLSYVREAAARIGAHLGSGRYTVVVNKSTVPVGTGDMVLALLEETSGLKAGREFDVVSNPEFLREGYAVEDVFYPDRIVIGAPNDQAAAMMKLAYMGILTRRRYGEWATLLPDHGAKPMPVWMQTDVKSSELIKYASNAFLAVKISYINEIARLCDALGANVSEVAKGMGLDSRIGGKFLQVSSGWSGSCFPKDTAELLATSGQYGYELQVVKAAVEANRSMGHYVVRKLQNRLKTLQGKTVCILGLTFKPNTDDARETQASGIIGMLTELGARVQAHDPEGADMFRQLHPRLPVTYCGTPEEAAGRSDAIVLLTHWDVYLSMDWGSILPSVRQPYVLDTRNVLPPGLLKHIGYAYEGIGI